MCLSQCLHDPAAAGGPGPAAPALPRVQLGPQPAQGRHGPEPRRAAAPGLSVCLSVCLGSGCLSRDRPQPRSPPDPLQAQSALALPAPIVLVLDEDGTAVETESFFRTLEEGTALMALSKEQTWTAPKVRGPLRGAGGWFCPVWPTLEVGLGGVGCTG